MSDFDVSRFTSVYLFLSTSKPGGYGPVPVDENDVDYWTASAFEDFAAASGFGPVPPCEATMVFKENEADRTTYSWRVDFSPANNEAWKFTRRVLDAGSFPLYDPTSKKHFADLNVYPF